jgi:hypothetical protein
MKCWTLHWTGQITRVVETRHTYRILEESLFEESTKRTVEKEQMDLKGIID